MPGAGRAVFFFYNSNIEPEEWFGGERYGAVNYNLEYAFAIGRYPVTVAQFRQFVAAVGITLQKPDCLQAPDNTPVVYVSWYEAMAFCDWLTARWQEQDRLPDGWLVDLPSEHEWEKAARGGEQIPFAQVNPLPPFETIQALSESSDFIVNKLTHRIFPWGNEENDLAERMNYNMNIGFVSAVGCFPAGRSPYGCEDLSGNAWEWCSTHNQDYPYPEPSALPQQSEAGKQQSSYVLRGGAFRDSRRDVRCISRHNSDPENCNSYFGFRVVLSPYHLTDDASGR